jgi:hypothetical protein
MRKHEKITLADRRVVLDEFFGHHHDGFPA